MTPDTEHGSRAATRTRGTVLLLSVLSILAVGSATLAATDGFYTRGQASGGVSVYASFCARCHGATLQGETAPPLVGRSFERSLTSKKTTAQQLYDYIALHMPGNTPGFLTETQYIQVLAFLLSANGYQPGPTELTKDTLANVELLPYPGRKSR